jgi:hypothetical protein
MTKERFVAGEATIFAIIKSNEKELVKKQLNF